MTRKDIWLLQNSIDDLEDTLYELRQRGRKNTDEYVRYMRELERTREALKRAVQRARRDTTANKEE